MLWTGARSSSAQHSLAFPSFAGAALTVNIGWLGLQRILAIGGSGYFPLRMLHEHELAGRLHRVEAAPEFRLPAYLCFPSERTPSHCPWPWTRFGEWPQTLNRSRCVAQALPGG